MTIQEWRTTVSPLLDAFVAATEQHQSDGEDGFVGPEYEEREFAAYLAYVELQEASRG